VQTQQERRLLKDPVESVGLVDVLLERLPLEVANEVCGRGAKADMEARPPVSGSLRIRRTAVCSDDVDVVLLSVRVGESRGVVLPMLLLRRGAIPDDPVLNMPS